MCLAWFYLQQNGKRLQEHAEEMPATTRSGQTQDSIQHPGHDGVPGNEET